jgi:hypothetical protein
MREVTRLLTAAPSGSNELDEAVSRELARAYLAYAHGLRRDRSQSALIRGSLELLVAATEKVARDLSYAEEYRAVAEDQASDHAMADAATRAAADLWRDE